MTQEAKDSAQMIADQRAAEKLRRDLDHEKAALKAQMGTLKIKLKNVQDESNFAAKRDRQRLDSLRKERREIAIARKAD